jgi:hypothetical protein
MQFREFPARATALMRVLEIGALREALAGGRPRTVTGSLDWVFQGHLAGLRTAPSLSHGTPHHTRKDVKPENERGRFVASPALSVLPEQR